MRFYFTILNTINYFKMHQTFTAVFMAANVSTAAALLVQLKDDPQWLKPSHDVQSLRSYRSSLVSIFLYYKQAQVLHLSQCWLVADISFGWINRRRYAPVEERDDRGRAISVLSTGGTVGVLLSHLKRLVPIPGVEPGPPGWKPGILTARPYGTCKTRCILWNSKLACDRYYVPVNKTWYV